MGFLPAGTWDTHIHCFDPALHPFKVTRTYTPEPAPLERLMEEAYATRIVLVQASVENGFDGLMNHLRRIRTEYPDVLARGIICFDENWSDINEETFDSLHDLGVRYCRIHGFFESSRNDLSALKELFHMFTRSYPAQKKGWGISAQLPLATWSLLKNSILHDPKLSRIPMIADHVGCISPADIDSMECRNFVDMLRSGRLYVKISCLYRRCQSDIYEMKPIIQMLANNAPHALLWGSDWPHVDSSNKSKTTSLALEQVDIQKELSTLQTWLTQSQWIKMAVENSERLFEK